MRASITVALCTMLACGTNAKSGGSGESSGATHSPGEGSALPHKTPEQFTVVPADEDAATALSQFGVISEIPANVNVSGVTLAIFQGVDTTKPCVEAHMGSEEAPSTAKPMVLKQGDEIDVSWKPIDLTVLPDGAYSEQLTLQGSFSQYTVDSEVIGTHPEGSLVIEYRDFEVAAGKLRILTVDEYRASLASSGGSVATAPNPAIMAPDLTPKNCDSSSTTATVTIMQASDPKP